MYTQIYCTLLYSQRRNIHSKISFRFALDQFLSTLAIHFVQFESGINLAQRQMNIK